MPPSGNTSAAAQDYYQYLFSQHISSLTPDRTHILWSGPIKIAFFAAILILFFFFYTYYFNRVHRQKGELYGAVSFAGSILERIGPVSIFSWMVWIGAIVWAIYYIISHIFNGFIY